MLFLLIIFILLLLAGLYIYIESTSLSVSNFEYIFDKLKVDEFDFVMLSDLHNMSYGKNNEKLIRIIDDIAPDAILLAGDMVTAGENTESLKEYESTIALLRRLKERYPLYYGIGNHEEKLKRAPYDFLKKWKAYTSELEKYGIHILQNETVTLEKEGIKIYGLDLENKYYKKFKGRPIEDDYLENIFGKVAEDMVSILIAHLPDQFEGYAKWQPDLVLSGHIHGGIIRIPFLGGLVSPQYKLFPKYDSGEFKLGKSTMILSRGVGTHSILIRINNRAEVVHVKLLSGRKGA
ncbi:MAG: metallophosphoesterase [Lachnospiraceae bacterium]|nr:metallophosphoesterase [Lachnospiraceae bacterium]